jgi:DNA-binding transcriptional LysR family regulator
MSVDGALITNLQEIAHEGALQGLGIAFAHDDRHLRELIARNRLKRVLADWSPTVPGMFLYYSSRRNQQPALRAFIDCLLDQDIMKKAKRKSP